LPGTRPPLHPSQFIVPYSNLFEDTHKEYRTAQLHDDDDDDDDDDNNNDNNNNNNNNNNRTAVLVHAMTLLDGSEESISHPGQQLRYQLNRRLGCTQSQYGWFWRRKNVLPFEPRAIQPVASPYTDYAVLYPTIIIIIIIQPGQIHQFTRKEIRKDYPDLMAVRSVRLSNYKALLSYFLHASINYVPK
jgi:hypothetical protein